MFLPRRSSRALPLAVLVLLSACYTTQRQALPAGGDPSLFADGKPLRLVLVDDAQVTLVNARLIGDSLVGQADMPRPRLGQPAVPPRRIAVALGDVRGVERRTLREGRTMLAIVAGVVAALYLSLAVVLSDGLFDS